MKIPWKVVDCDSDDKAYCEYKAGETDGIAELFAYPNADDSQFTGVGVMLQSNDINNRFDELDEPSILFDLSDIIRCALENLSGEPDSIRDLAACIHAIVDSVAADVIASDQTTEPPSSQRTAGNSQV